MGVDHGGTGDKSPRIWIVPLRFCHGTKGAFCGLQNTPKSVFGRGAGSRRSSSPRSRLRRGHPFPCFTILGTDPPSALAMRPPEFQPMGPTSRHFVPELFVPGVSYPGASMTLTPTLSLPQPQLLTLTLTPNPNTSTNDRWHAGYETPCYDYETSGKPTGRSLTPRKEDFTATMSSIICDRWWYLKVLVMALKYHRDADSVKIR